MKKIRVVIAVLLSLVILVSFCSCKIEMKGNPSTTQAPVTDGHGEDVYQEYPISKYELKGNAFEVSGELNLYKYDALPDAVKVIDVFNSYYDIDLKVDEETHYDSGYGNWFWDDGSESSPSSASVSMSEKTGKFSFYYVPKKTTIINASLLDEVDKDEWTEKVTDFVNQFEFVTGKLVLKNNVVYNDLYYPFIADGAEESEDVQVKGRKYMFVSEEYSKQTVNAQDGLDCCVECGSSDITDRDVQYFVVTIFNDGTIVSADNYITKADIVSDGTVNMPDESNLDNLLTYMTSTVKDDTMIIRRIYIESYSNYFGEPEITPTIKVEYAFKSNPNDIQTTDFGIGAFEDGI